MVTGGLHMGAGLRAAARWLHDNLAVLTFVLVIAIAVVAFQTRSAEVNRSNRAICAVLHRDTDAHNRLVDADIATLTAALAGHPDGNAGTVLAVLIRGYQDTRLPEPDCKLP